MLDMEQLTKLIETYAIPWGLKLLMAAVIFFGGRVMVRWAHKVLKKVLNRAKVDTNLADILTAVASGLLNLLVILAVLNQLEIDTSSLVALLATAGLAIGLALQNSLQNFASGVMLTVFRPFKIGEMIEVGDITGMVKSMDTFSCTLRTSDNKEIVLPNSVIYQGRITIVDHTEQEDHRIDMVFRIGYDDDLLQAKGLLKEIVSAHSLVLESPKAEIFVKELGESSVNFAVQPWVKSRHFSAVKGDITEAVKLRFDQEGISIGHKRVDVYIHSSDGVLSQTVQLKSRNAD